MLGADYVAHVDPTDNPRAINAQLYVAVVFPQGAVATKKAEGHLLGTLQGYDGKPLTYYFGSAWSKYDVRSLDEWKSRIGWFTRSLKTPLEVSYE